MTTTSLAPAVRDGVTAEIDVDDTRVTLVAAAPPIVTPLTDALNPVPVIVTLVPPANGPLLGEIDVTVGAAASVVKLATGLVAYTVPPPPHRSSRH